MSDVVNLNRARKAKLKVAAKATAAQHRVKFGRSKFEKAVDDSARRSARTILDQAKREPE